MMEKNKKNKKAFLFTLGLVLVALAILSFAKFVFLQSENEKLLFQTAAIAGRVEDMDSSLQRSISEALAIYSNVGAYFGNSTVVFEEPLPNGAGGLESSLSSLKNLAEQNETALTIRLNRTLNELPYIIMPQNLTYRHNVSIREIIIEAGQQNLGLQRYKTTITLGENVTCDWSYIPGNFSYELNVVNPKDSGCDHDRLVSLDSNITITITSDSNAGNKITIKLRKDKFSIKMDEGSEFAASVKSEIYLANNPKEVWFSRDIIDIKFDSFGLRKKGGVRII